MLGAPFLDLLRILGTGFGLGVLGLMVLIGEITALRTLILGISYNSVKSQEECKISSRNSRERLHG